MDTNKRERREAIALSIVFGVLLIVILVYGLADAQGYSYDNTGLGLRTAVAYQLRTKVNGTRLLDTATINLAINRAISEVCTQAPAYEKIDTLTVDSTAEGGVLPIDFVAMNEVYRISGDSIRWELMPRKLVKPQVGSTIDPVDPISGSRVHPGLELHDRASLLSPNEWQVFGGTMMLFPKYLKNATDSFLVLYYAMDTTFAEAVATKVDQRYMEAVVYYAAALCAATKQQFDDANWFMAAYEKEMARLPTFKGLEIR